MEVFFSSGYLGRAKVPFYKTIINLPRTNEKLQCKGESYLFSGQPTTILDPILGFAKMKNTIGLVVVEISTNKQKPYYFVYYSGYAP